MAATITVGGGEKPGTRGDRGGDLRGFDRERPETRRAVARANVQRERLASPQAKRERRRSRTRYRDLKAGSALRVGQVSHRAVLRDRVPRPLAAARKRGMVVERYASDFAAVLRRREGAGRDEPGVMAMSTLALRSRDATGQNRPVDLSLAQRADGRWAPENPRVDITIGDRVADGLRITGREIGVVPLDVTDRPGIRSGDAVFFANSAPDSDHIVRVTPAGAESLVQLRSPASPERFRYRIDLPAGGAMREQTDGTIVISRHGRRVGSITTPTAWDADHKLIPLKSTLRANVLILDVAHRGKDVRYPVMLDPNYVDILQYEWREERYNSGANKLRYWSFETNDSAKIDGSSGPLEWGHGLYALSRGGNQYLPTGTYGYWRFTAPGTTSVLQAEWTYMQHFAINTGGPYPCLDYGLMTTANNWRTHTKVCEYLPYAYRLSCWDCDDRDGFSYDPAVNGARFGVRIYDSPTIANVYSYLGESTLYLADPENPTIEVTSRPPTVWTNSTATPIAATATDPGLGVQSLAIDGAGTYINNDCLTLGPCRGSVSLTRPITNLPDGITPINITARDASYYSHRDTNGNAVPAQHQTTETVTVKLDRTPPRIDTVSGSLYDQRDSEVPRDSKTLTGAEYQLHVDAADAHSGVKRIEVRIGGNLVAFKDGTCGPQGGCPLSLDWTLNADSLVEGTHTVTIKASDNVAENPPSPTTSFPITVDRQGTVMHAEQWDGVPTDANSINEASQWAVPNAGEARTEEALSTSTLGSTPCSGGVCAQATVVSDEDGAGDTPPAFSRIVGSTANDPRILNDFLTTQTPTEATQSSGTLTDVLASWQMPPPGHGSTFTRYRLTATETIDDVSTTIVDDHYFDTKTSLPVRRDHQEGDAPADSTYYVYDKSRADRASFAGDYFALTKPSPAASDTTTTLPPETQEPEPDPPSPESDLLARSLDLRSLLGLTTDQSTVQQIVNDLTSSVRHEAMDLIGVPLSATELGTVKQLLDTQSYGDKVGQFAAANPAAYAGAFIDNQDRLVVRLVQQSAPLEQQLRALVPIGDRLVTQAATTTLAALTATQQQIESDADNGSLAGFDVRGIGVSQEHGKVTVELAGNSPQAEADLQTRYGPTVRTAEGQTAVPMRRATPGQAMYAEKGDGLTPTEGNGCTIGPSVYKDAGRKRAYYALSAGHCSAHFSPTPILWRHGFPPTGQSGGVLGREVGNLVRGLPRPTAKVDGLITRLAGPGTASTRVSSATDRILLRFGNGSRRYARVKGEAGLGPEKAVVCWTGAQTYRLRGHSQCGRVTGYNRRSTLRDIGLVTHVTTVITRENSDCSTSDPETIETSLGGDSGGPAFVKKEGELGVRIYGTHSGSGCEDRDDGPFGQTTRYELGLITELRGGLKNGFGVSVFCRRYGRPVAGCA